MVAMNNPGKFEKILFATDLTEAGTDAAAYAHMMARSYGAKLHVIHVVDTSGEAAGFYLPHISYENLDKEMVENARGMLDKYCARHFEGDPVEKEVRSGEPYEEILKVVEENDIDVVVMGALSRGRLDHFLFGSTTERVMRKINIPVLVIPPSK